MKPESARPYALLGVVFIVVSVLILILALMNYLQDGRLSLTVVIPFPMIFLGLLLYSRGKRMKGQDG